MTIAKAGRVAVRAVLVICAGAMPWDAWSAEHENPASAMQRDVRAALAGLTCAVVMPDFVADGTVRLNGFVGDDADIPALEEALFAISGVERVEMDVAVHPWPFCEVLELTAPYEQPRTGKPLKLAVIGADERARLRKGSDLIIEIDLPEDAVYLYLGYVQQDGTIGHIATMAVRDWTTRGERIRYSTGYKIVEPFGRELIVAITSTQPLFNEARPAYEPAESYLTALRQRLTVIGGTDPSIHAAHQFIETVP